MTCGKIFSMLFLVDFFILDIEKTNPQSKKIYQKDRKKDEFIGFKNMSFRFNFPNGEDYFEQLKKEGLVDEKGDATFYFCPGPKDFKQRVELLKRSV